MANARIREALTAGNNTKEKGPQQADGILSVTPDSPDAAEWRSKCLLDCAGTSSTFLDDDEDGPKPHDLYGRFTWKIENFSEISKRELRSNVFDVGSYKWYILVYPQGCDVCNHLSLFLCVADYDKLLPGWSHFAQFTIAVVNKDPKKSKYSDTLHRFCKKEHDWGWKKFMELSKVLDGFTVQDTLVIKAQVQVILDKPNRPFKCLDAQYRRELVRVYLTNVESICRKFCDERRARLGWVREDPKKFKEFWDGLSSEQRKPLIKEKCDTILKGIVKQFFNEKEVTSTLVMDSLYSGCRQIEEYTRQWQQGKAAEGAPAVTINTEKSVFGFGCSLMEIIDRASKEYIPLYKDDKAQDALTLRSGQEGDDMRRDSVERDEKRLAELGRKTVEMFVISHVLCERLEIAYREAEALRRQELLIAEEEEAGRREETRLAAKAQADREKRAKKKERKKQRKEQERIKKEAEEAEKVKAEAERRLEAERKQLEAHKKRVEDEEQQRTQQVQRAQRLLQQEQRKKPAAASSAPAKDRAAQPSAAASAAPTAAAHTPSANGVASQSREQPASTGRGPVPQNSGRALKPAVPEQPLVTRMPSDGPSTSRMARSSSSSSSSSSGSSSSSDSTADDSDSEDSEDNTPSSKAQLSSSSSARTAPQAVQSVTSSSQPAAAAGKAAVGGGQLRSVDELKSQVFVLQERVRDLESTLRDKDTEILALRAQLSELNSSVELVDLVKQASAVNKAKDGTEADTPSSTASATPTASSAGSAALSPSQTLPQKLSGQVSLPPSRQHVLTIRQHPSSSASSSATSSQDAPSSHEGTAAAAGAGTHLANGSSGSSGPLPANVPRHMHPAPHPPSIPSDPAGARPNAWGLPPREHQPPTSTDQAPLTASASSDPPPSLHSDNFPPPSKDPPAPSTHAVLQVNYSAAARGRAPPHPGAHVVAAVAAAAAAASSPTGQSPPAAPSYEQGPAPSQTPAPPPGPAPPQAPVSSRPPPPSTFPPPAHPPARGAPGPAVTTAAGAHPLPHIRPIVTHIPPSTTPAQQQATATQQSQQSTLQQQASPEHPKSTKQQQQPPQQQQQQQQHINAASSQPQTPQQRSQPSSPGAANHPHPPPSPAAASAAADMATRGPAVVHVERANSGPAPAPKSGPAGPPPPLIPPPPVSRPQTADKEASANHGSAAAGPAPYLPPTSAPPTVIAANGVPPPPPPPLHQSSLQDGPTSFRNPPVINSASGNAHALVNPRPASGSISPRGVNSSGEDGPVTAPPPAPRPMRHLNHGDGPFGTGYVPQPQASRGRGLGFGAMAKRAHAAMPPSENQGLDDFQHMQMITDILGTD